MADVLPHRLEPLSPEHATRHTGLACESQLRVAAATLRRTSENEVSATTVVGVLGADDMSALQRLLAAIQQEFDVDARLRLYIGSFSVRFTRRSHTA
ncbi:MAG: hypothetical protein JOZ81_00415 [Chloroflexi bacterium]|nr:hypothetical protein [Chloroflexota bacterium]